MKRICSYLKQRLYVKHKIITASCMFFIIASLYVTCYVLFYRTVEVDVTRDAYLIFDGESSSATVKVKNALKTYNQRIQDFMNSITYEVTPNTNLSNGDVITIIASYDEELAQQYNIQPIALTKEIVVEDLPERIQSVEELTETFLTELTQKGEEYLKKNITSILQEDFTQFSISSDVKLISQTLKYRVFLDSESNENKDKILDIYEITAEGMINTSSEEEQLEIKESTIYYMVTYNELNTAFEIKDANIYGEKIIWTESDSLADEEIFKKYLNKRYETQYELTYLDIE